MSANRSLSQSHVPYPLFQLSTFNIPLTYPHPPSLSLLSTLILPLTDLPSSLAYSPAGRASSSAAATAWQVFSPIFLRPPNFASDLLGITEFDSSEWPKVATGESAGSLRPYWFFFLGYVPPSIRVISNGHMLLLQAFVKRSYFSDLSRRDERTNIPLFFFHRFSFNFQMFREIWELCVLCIGVHW